MSPPCEKDCLSTGQHTRPPPLQKGMKMSCKLSAIVAVCDDWGIGLDGGMVVENREDMRHFVACTTGHPVIMGRRTLESFPGGRPLRNRRNVVLTRDPSFSREGIEVVRTLDEALAAVAGETEAWVIGGGEVYRQLLPCCKRAIVTRNHCVRPCDTHFPNLDEDPQWEVAEVRPGGATPEGVAFDFVTYRRRA